MPNYYDIDAISQSRLKALLQCPFYYKAAYVDKTFVLDSDAMEFGRALDCYITEPDKFHTSYIRVARRGEPVNGVTQLTGAVYDEVLLVGEFVRTNPLFQELIEGLLPQVEILEKIQKSKRGKGFHIKAKLDYFGIRNETAVIVDLKTTRDAEQSMFIRTMHDFDYPLQFAFYKMAVACTDATAKKFEYYIPVVDRSKQHRFAIYEIDPAIVDAAAVRLFEIMEARPWDHLDKEEKRVMKDPNHTCPLGTACPAAGAKTIEFISKEAFNNY